MRCGRQDRKARSYRSATGGKYVTRYFEENAKKYRESPDKTALRGGAGWPGATWRGASNRPTFSRRCARPPKNNRLNWTFVRAGADRARDGGFSCRMRTNRPSCAASCVRRSKIKEKAGKPAWACPPCACDAEFQWRQIRTASAASDVTTASPVTAFQPSCASNKLPIAAPAAIPMNMPTNSTALRRLRDAGSIR